MFLTGKKKLPKNGTLIVVAHGSLTLAACFALVYLLLIPTVFPFQLLRGLNLPMISNSEYPIQNHLGESVTTHSSSSTIITTRRVITVTSIYSTGSSTASSTGYGFSTLTTTSTASAFSFSSSSSSSSSYSTTSSEMVSSSTSSLSSSSTSSSSSSSSSSTASSTTSSTTSTSSSQLVGDCLDSGSGNNPDYTITYGSFRLGNYPDNTPSVVHTNCVFYDPSSEMFGWNWTRATGGAGVDWETIIFGHQMWASTSTTSVLPVLISQVSQVTASITFTQSVTGNYETGYDIFITSSPGAGVSFCSSSGCPDITDEIMIFLTWSRSAYDSFEISSWPLFNDGYGSYHYYFSQCSGCARLERFFAVNQGSRTVNIRSFLDYIASTYRVSLGYLADIEFGTEILYGSGQMNAISYSLLVGSNGTQFGLLDATQFALIPQNAASIDWKDWETSAK